MSQTLDNKD